MAKIKQGKNTSKKEVIIKNAAVLFRSKGFAAATMRELAEAVGVEAPSLYNHIGSKSEILQAICFKVANAFNEQLDATENMHTGTIAQLETIIRFHIHMMMDCYDEVFVANHDWKQLEEPWQSNFSMQRRNYEKRLVAIVEEGISKKECRNLNPYIVVLTMLSAVRGLEFWQRHKKNISVKVVEDDMVNQLIKGIAVK